MINKSTSYVYFLVFPKIKGFKIGKADDIHCRIATLTRWWGDVDYEKSYLIKTGAENVFKIETMFHTLIDDFKLDFEQGDGKTELFKMDALEILLKYLDIYESNSERIKVQKGIDKPISATIKPSNKTIKQWKSQSVRKINDLINSLNRFNENSVKVLKLLNVLIKYNHRFKYQYEIVDNRIKFRFIADKYSIKGTELLFDCFRFSFIDFSGMRGRNVLGALSRKNERIQFDISLDRTTLLNDERDILSGCYHYFMNQFMKAIKYLPERSPILKEDISYFDEKELWGGEF